MPTPLTIAVMAASTSFGKFLVGEGELAGGAGALGGSIALIIGAIAKDLGRDIDHWAFATKGAALGALFGVTWGLAERLPWG